MPQHKLNQKKSKAPVGIQKKSKKNVQKKPAPKKGAQLILAPKKKGAVEEAKMNKTVTQVINQRNEEMLRARLDQNTGRNSNKK